jgi:hypothetical protein
VQILHTPLYFLGPNIFPNFSYFIAYYVVKEIKRRNIRVRVVEQQIQGICNNKDVFESIYVYVRCEDYKAPDRGSEIENVKC